MSDAPELRAAGERPSREDWIALRSATGRATPLDYRHGPILLGYQSRLVETVSTHAVTVAEKSRRTGATWGAASYAVLLSASDRADGGMDTLYTGTSHDMAKEFIDAAAQWARAYDKACSTVSEFIFDDGTDAGVKALRIDFRSGFSIIALSSKPRSFRGRQGFAILDEAAFVDNLAELMKAALAFLIWGGKVLVISTHNGADNLFNQLVTDIRAGRLDYGLVRFDLDDALRDGLYERICLVLGRTWTPEAEADWREKLIADYRDGADEELYCIPSQGSGVFLPGPLIEARMHDAPVLRLSVPPSFTQLPSHRRQAEVAAWIEDALAPVMRASIDPLLQSTLGMDVGRYRDLSVLAPLQIGRTMRRVCPFLVEMERLPFEQQLQIAVHLWRGLPRRIGGRVDATGIGAGIAEDLQLNHGMEAVKITVEWYRLVMPPFKAAFEDDMILVPRDAEVAADLRAFKMIRGIATLPALRKATAGGGARHGDAGIALVLAYDASRAAGGEIYAYQAARPGAEDARREDRRTGLRAVSETRDLLAGRRRDGLW